MIDAVFPDGEEGELIFTSLTKQALPIIRYRTRDLTRLMPGGSTPMRRMAKITGRSDDMLIVRGVNVFPSQVEEQILRCSALAPHFTIEIRRPDRLDEVTLVVESRYACDERAQMDCSAQLATYVKEVIGISALVQVRQPGELPRSTGKANRVSDFRFR